MLVSGKTCNPILYWKKWENSHERRQEVHVFSERTMDPPTDGRTDGRTGEQRTGGRMDGRTDARRDGLTDERTDGRGNIVTYGCLWDPPAPVSQVSKSLVWPDGGILLLVGACADPSSVQNVTCGSGPGQTSFQNPFPPTKVPFATLLVGAVLGNIPSKTPSPVDS